MDDLNEKLAGILNDPDSMAQIRQMAESLLGNNGADASAYNPSPTGIGSDELMGIMSVMSQIQNSGDDDRTRLLSALKPHLSERRQGKVDTAIKILKLLELWPVLKETGILNL